MNILIVDDEKLARDRLKRLIEKSSDHAVVGEAADGRSAITQVEKYLPDVVLLDIRMPGMDGLEVARHLMKLENPPAIIFCTAYGEHALEAFQTHAVGYLLKPVKIEELHAALASAEKLNRAQLQKISTVMPEPPPMTNVHKEQRASISVRARAMVWCWCLLEKYVVLWPITNT